MKWYNKRALFFCYICAKETKVTLPFPDIQIQHRCPACGAEMIFMENFQGHRLVNFPDSPKVEARRQWVGFDIDGTLADASRTPPGSIGPPVPLMLTKLLHYQHEGVWCKAFTARASEREGKKLVENWILSLNLPEEMPVTCVKDYGCVRIYDDRAVQVVTNIGVEVGSIDWMISYT